MASRPVGYLLPLHEHSVFTQAYPVAPLLRQQAEQADESTVVVHAAVAAGFGFRFAQASKTISANSTKKQTSTAPGTLRPPMARTVSRGAHGNK